jgi:hypothetical protein
MPRELADSPAPARASETSSIPLGVVAAAITTLVFVLRSSTFFHSVENWDESLYLLMGRSLLDGEALYTDIWEHKPPGIALLFALAQLVFGRTVLSIRIFASLAVCASSLLLFLIGRSLRDQTTGIVAGLLYAIFSITYGRSANVEISFTPFVLLAFYVVLSHGRAQLLDRPGLPLALGVAAGLALQVSYIAVFDLSALALFLVGDLWKAAREKPARFFRFVGLASIGPTATFALVALWFSATGHFADYIDANFAANVGYVADKIDYRRLGWMVTRRVREAFPLWFSLPLAGLYLVFLRALGCGTRRGLAAGLLWAALALPGICITGRLFAHYFLELLPAQCLVCALVIGATIEETRRVSAGRTAAVLGLILLAPALRAAEKPLLLTARTVYHRYVEGTDHWGDEPAAVAEYLRARLTKDDFLYVADYHPILYYLVPAKVPTRFPFPIHITDEWWQGLTRTDPQREVRSIFAKRPLYVVKAEEKDTSFYRFLHEELERSYQLEQTIGGVAIYRRKDDGGGERHAEGP